jgi:hypothetical protein
MGGMRQTVKENNAGCYSFYGAASAASQDFKEKLILCGVLFFFIAIMGEVRHTVKETNTMRIAVLFSNSASAASQYFKEKLILCCLLFFIVITNTPITILYSCNYSLSHAAYGILYY